MRKKGKILYLHGTSSSGKTTLAKSLQNSLAEMYLHWSGDDFYGCLPERAIKNPADYMDQFHIRVRAFHNAMFAISNAGLNVIVDSIYIKFVDSEEIEDFAKNEVYLIGLTSSLPELKRREIARCDRKIGIAETQLSYFCENLNFDLFINTADLDIQASTELIISKISNGANPVAFREYLDQGTWSQTKHSLTP